MKKLSLGLIGLMGLIWWGYAAEDKPAPPTMPSEVTLTSGRVLRGVKVIRWENNRVVLRHTAGADPIAFSIIAEPLRGELPAIKAAWTETMRKDSSSGGTRAAVSDYQGQVFVMTRGAGAYKISGVTVRVYFRPEAEVRDIFKWGSEIPAADAVTTSDADGKFKFSAPKMGAVTLVAKSKRLVGYGSEQYLWIYDASRGGDRFTPLLTNNNLEPEPYVESGAYNSL